MTGFAVSRALAARKGIGFRFPHDLAYFFEYQGAKGPATYIYPAIIFG